MTEQLAIPWVPNETWINNGHQVEAARLTCGCTTTIPPGHPVLRDNLNWPAALHCSLHGGKHAVSVVVYTQHQGVSLSTRAPKEAA